MRWYELDSSGLGQKLMESSLEHDKEILSSIKRWEILEYQRHSLTDFIEI
jgi:hypothetical protein